MPVKSLFDPEFMQAVVNAGIQARERALAEGHPVVFRDDRGRYVQEFPDGRLFEIRFERTADGDSRVQIVREITADAR